MSRRRIDLDPLFVIVFAFGVVLPIVIHLGRAAGWA